MKAKVLNSREVKKIINLLKEQFLIKDLKLDYVFILGKEGKLYVIDKKLGELDMKGLRVNSLGMYFGKLESDGVRLSIEGSQLVGPLAKKNVVSLSDGDIARWVSGSDLDLKGSYDGFVIVKYKDDFFGSGKFSKGRLLNFVPKSRRVKPFVE